MVVACGIFLSYLLLIFQSGGEGEESRHELDVISSYYHQVVPTRRTTPEFLLIITSPPGQRQQQEQHRCVTLNPTCEFLVRFHFRNSPRFFPSESRWKKRFYDGVSWMSLASPSTGHFRLFIAKRLSLSI